MYRSGAALALASILATACVPENPTVPSTTTQAPETTTTTVAQGEVIEVDDAQLSWAYNRYSQAGALGAWSYDAEGPNVVINRVNGQAVTGDPSTAHLTFNVAQFDGGTGTIDSITGAGSIVWETGDVTLNAYQGSFGAPDEILSSPRLTIETDGSGTLSFDASIGAGLDMNGDPSPAVGPERRVLVTFDSLDELGAESLSIEPDFAGRVYPTSAEEAPQASCVVDGVETAGSWPAEWTSFVPPSLRPHYYSTSCGGMQPYKAPLPVTVRWDHEAPTIVTQPTLSKTAFALGESLGAVGASVAFTGVPTPNIQWQRSTDGETWTDISGVTGYKNTAALGVADNNTYVRAVLDNGVGEPLATNALGPITVSVTTTTLSSMSPATSFLYPGQNATFALNVDGAPIPQYQMEISRDGGTTWDPIAPTTTTARPAGVRVSLTLTNVQLSDHGTKVRLRAWNGVGPEKTSTVGTLDVQWIAPTFTGAPVDTYVLEGGYVSFSPGGVAARPSVSYQWEVSTDGGTTWSNWSSPSANSTAASLQLSHLDLTMDRNDSLVRVRVTNSVGEAVSSAAKLSIIASTGQKRVVIVPHGPLDPTQPMTFTALAEGLTPPAGVTSNLNWLITKPSLWQPGQPINGTGAVVNQLGGLGTLIGNDVNRGKLRNVFTFAANTFTPGESYGVGVVAADAGERFYDAWVPLEFITP